MKKGAMFLVDKVKYIASHIYEGTVANVVSKMELARKYTSEKLAIRELEGLIENAKWDISCAAEINRIIVSAERDSGPVRTVKELHMSSEGYVAHLEEINHMYNITPDKVEKALSISTSVKDVDLIYAGKEIFITDWLSRWVSTYVVRSKIEAYSLSPIDDTLAGAAYSIVVKPLKCMRDHAEALRIAKETGLDPSVLASFESSVRDSSGKVSVFLDKYYSILPPTVVQSLKRLINTHGGVNSKYDDITIARALLLEMIGKHDIDFCLNVSYGPAVFKLKSFVRPDGLHCTIASCSDDLYLIIADLETEIDIYKVTIGPSLTWSEAVTRKIVHMELTVVALKRTKEGGFANDYRMPITEVDDISDSWNYDSVMEKLPVDRV